MQIAIKFVRGAVAVKDLVPILTTFHIYNGRIQGYNGSVCIDHPLERKDLNITIPAKPFIKAVDICGGEPEITKLENERVQLSKGSFKCKIALENQDDFPVAEHPVAHDHKLGDGFLDMVKLVAPFISDDASRPWSMSIKISQGYMYATNNIVIVRTKLNAPCDDFIMSSELVTELLRIWQAPSHVTNTSEEIFFKYPNGAWIKGQAPAEGWPDIAPLFESGFDDLKPIPGNLKGAVEKLASFAENGLIRFTADGVFAGHEDDAHIEGLELDEIAFHVSPLTEVLKVANHYDLTTTPPRFAGERIKGIICNVKI